MTTQQTTEFMLKLLNWWPNLYRENDPDEMSDAWAVSLTDVPYDAAMAGAVALSRTMTWRPLWRRSVRQPSRT